MRRGKPVTLDVSAGNTRSYGDSLGRRTRGYCDPATDTRRGQLDPNFHDLQSRRESRTALGWEKLGTHRWGWGRGDGLESSLDLGSGPCEDRNRGLHRRSRLGLGNW